MAGHTATPWMTQRCGELAPNDLMIVADLGKRPDGIQMISTVAKVLSIRQTPEDTQANAEFIVRAVNAHDDLVAALRGLRSWMSPGGDDRIDADLEAADAALAKAGAL